MMEFKTIHNQFLAEFQTLRGILLRTVGIFFFCATLFLMVPFSMVQVGSFVLPVPGSGATIAERFIQSMQVDLVPENVPLIALTPFDPFMASMAVAGTLALIVLIPFLAVEFWRYVHPGLYVREKKILALLFFASVGLFIVGAYFAYAFIIPTTFEALYKFTPEGSLPFFSLRELVGTVAGITVLVGLLFELPIVMTILTYLRILPSSFWHRYFRHAILLIIVLSAIITPDGSGISMVLLAVPICFAYAIGYGGSVLLERRQ